MFNFDKEFNRQSSSFPNCLAAVAPPSCYLDLFAHAVSTHDCQDTPQSYESKFEKEFWKQCHPPTRKNEMTFKIETESESSDEECAQTAKLF